MAECSKGMEREKTNRRHGGYTLVEMMISIAIMLVVSTAIFSFMIYSSRIFNKSNAEADMQQEAQIMKNQINDLVTDTAKGLKYVVAQSEADRPYGADVCLTVFGENAVSYLAWVKDEEKIYFIEKSLDNIQQGEDGEYDIAFSETEKNASSWALMAEYVTAFSCNLSEVTQKHQLFSCELGFQLAGSEYATTHTIMLRNQISSDKEIKDLYQDYVRPVENIVTDVLLTPYMADAVPGEKVNFHASVVTVGTPNKEVSYTVEGSKSPSGKTSISADGVLTVGEDEESPTLTVVCRSVHDSAISSFALVNVARIESVHINCLTPPPYESRYYFANNYVAFSALVEGDFITEEARKVTWEIVNSYPVGASGTEAVIVEHTDTTCRINTGSIIGNVITIKAVPQVQTAPDLIGEHQVSIAQMEMGEMYIEAVGGLYEVERNGSLQLNAYVNGEGSHSGISFAWEIVKDTTGGRVKIESATGLVTADKGIPYNKEYTVTVKVTARTSQGSRDKTCDIKIQTVSIKTEPEAVIVVPGNSSTAKVTVTGLAGGEKDIRVTQNPPVLNFTVVQLENGTLKMGCTTDKLYRSKTNLKISLESGAGIQATLPVYFKESNIQLPGGYAPVPGDEFFPESTEKGIPIDNETVIINGRTFLYAVEIQGDEKVWYLYLFENGQKGKKYKYNETTNVYDAV